MPFVGLLWGSVGAYNTLQLFNGATLVDTIGGAQVTAVANGDQGLNGTLYVNITASGLFNRVVASSSSFAFESDNVAFSRPPPQCRHLRRSACSDWRCWACAWLDAAAEGLLGPGKAAPRGVAFFLSSPGCRSGQQGSR